MSAARLKKSPVTQWVTEALAHAKMSQSALSRALTGRADDDADRSIINKILKQGRKVSAEELYAIERITKYSVPPGLAGEAEIIKIPILDRVTAGKLRTPVSQLQVEDFPLMAFADLGEGEWFALRVEDREDGDSMDRISPPNSIIIVNQADKDLVSGKCYVFSIDGETTYKMWQDDDPPYLSPQSTNSRHKPILITSKKKRDFSVVGRVKRTILDL